MTQQENPDEENVNREDDIDAHISDENAAHEDQVDAIRTGDTKKRDYHDKPFDEQMYNSFDDIRHQQGSQPEDEEAD
jgi:hypothetical protein